MPYCYTYTDLVTAKQSERQIAYQKIKNTFGSSNMVAVIVPSGDYESEGRILDELDACAEVKSTMGLANIEAMDGYMLTDAVTPRQLAEMADLDFEVAKALYVPTPSTMTSTARSSTAWTIIKCRSTTCSGSWNRRCTTATSRSRAMCRTRWTTCSTSSMKPEAAAERRLQPYGRLSEPARGDRRDVRFVNKMHDIIGKYYATDSFYVVGNTTSAMDLSSSFGEDNLLISVLSALFVILVLLFTFKSAGLPVLLIIVIQGSIWINFSVPYLQHTPLYFLGYLIVNSIQMGANIDYAIVISSHYTDLKKVMRRGRPSSQP